MYVPAAVQSAFMLTTTVNIACQMHVNALAIYSRNAKECIPVIGTLLVSWGGDGAFLAVTVLALDITSLTGTLPPSWRGPKLLSCAECHAAHN